MNGLGFSLYRLQKAAEAQERADAAGAMFGARSLPCGISTALMGVGFVGAAIGLGLSDHRALVIGGGVFLLGLLVAVVEALFDMMKS